MTSSAIRPIQFANAIQYALGYRSAGMSTHEAARRALCDAGSPTDDWICPLIAFLNDSPSVAQAWAARQLDASLSRAYGSSELSA